MHKVFENKLTWKKFQENTSYRWERNIFCLIVEPACFHSYKMKTIYLTNFHIIEWDSQIAEKKKVSMGHIYTHM